MGKTPKIFLYAKKGEIKTLKKKVPSTKYKINEEDPGNLLDNIILIYIIYYIRVI